MDKAPVSLKIEDGVADIVFSRGPAGNPFDEAFCEAFLDAVIACAETPAVRAVLIRAEGKMFSVGGDLRWLGQARETVTRRVQRSTSVLNTAIARLAKGDAPVVAAVHGMTAGGAVGLVSSVDILLASKSARFYPAFPAIGLPCDCGCSYFLPRLVGRRKATEFLVLNQTWDADQAAEYGLVSRVVDDAVLEADARAIARKLATGPTRALGELRRLLVSDSPLETQLEAEAAAVVRSARTDDCWNAIESLLAKEVPHFHGR